MLMQNGCFRSSRSFILGVLLVCSFSEAALASRRPGSVGPFFAVASVVGVITGMVYVFGDNTTPFEMPGYYEIKPDLYLKYESIKTETSRQEGAAWQLDSQHRMPEDDAQSKGPSEVISPVLLKAVPSTPETFAARNNKKGSTRILRAGEPDNWDVYLKNEMFWKLHPLFVGLGRDQEKMQPFYRPILSVCLDFTGENRFSVNGVLSECINAAFSRLKEALPKNAGVYAIGEPGSERLRSFVGSGKRIRLPVYSVFDGVVRTDWELFYVVAGSNGEFELVLAK